MKRILIIGLFILTAISAGFAQTPADCNSDEDDNIAAVYNFVPENSLQADFRRLSKTEEGFINALRQTPAILVEDHTTQILSEEMMPEVPAITDQLVPPPAESGANFYVNGKISKAGAGFLLTVDLHKASDNSLLNEVQTPFASPDGAEAAGTANAAQQLSFLATQTQAARTNRATSNRLIKPVITLQFDKPRLKPNEQAHGTVILTDCDGMPLKNHEFTSYARLDQGQTLVSDSSGPRTTNEVGEYTGVVSSRVPGVLTQIVTLKYNDLHGVPREISESKSIVISGGEGDLWQMSVRWQYRQRTRYTTKDLQTHRTEMGATVTERKGDFIFLFKVPTSPDGAVFTNEIKSFNGFGTAIFRHGEVGFDNEYQISFASGIVDQKPDSIQNVQAGFGFNPDSKDFQFSVSGIAFRGERDLNACGRIANKYECHSRHEEFVDSVDGADKLSGEISATPEMIRSGVYTYSFQENKMLPANHVKTETTDETHEGSYVSHRVEIKISRVNPNRGKVIN